MARGSAVRIVAGGLALAALWWLERKRPLRRRVEPVLRRQARNAGLGLVSAVVVQVADRPVTAALARRAEARGWGLAPRIPDARLRTLATLLLLDYGMYLWHVALHRVPALWRFHRVHHGDLDLDVSTALRFHCGEMLWSVLLRAAQVTLVGASPRALGLYHSAMVTSVVFHHSNLRLPPRVERVLATLLVTPSMHGIHHSSEPAEMHSNWSSLLNVWDRLHGTLRDDVPQEALVIGVKGEPARGFAALLAAPFQP